MSAMPVLPTQHYYSSLPEHGGVPRDGNREWFRRSCSECMAALISKQSLLLWLWVSTVQFRCNRRHSYRSACWETVTWWSIVNTVSDRHPSFESQCQATWHRCGIDDLWPPDKVMMTVPIGACTAFNLPSSCALSLWHTDSMKYDSHACRDWNKSTDG